MPDQQLKEWEENWKASLYFEVLEDLLFHQKMLPHHVNQAEGMDEIREDIKKLEDFISSLLISLLTRKSEEIGGLRLGGDLDDDLEKVADLESYNQGLTDAQAILLKG